MSRLLAILAVVLVSALTAATAGANGLPPGGTFFDDDGNTHEGGIEAIAAEGITRGCNPPQNSEYCPDDEVTRGQMAAFLRRALEGILVPGDLVEFIDDDGSVFEADIEWLGATGVTKGCNPPANDEFCPNDPVTRGQMAAFLVRAFGYSEGGGADLFIDDDGSTFENDIDKLGTAGITKGCNPPTNDRFCPGDPVLRDQMASFLSRALELSAIQPPVRVDTMLGSELNFITIAESQGCTALQLDPFDGNLEECAASTSVSANEMFWVEHGWFSEDWSLVPFDERQEFLSDSTRFDLSINDFKLDLFEEFFLDGDTAHKVFRFQFADNLSTTTHTLVGEWITGGVVEIRIMLDITVTP